NNDAGANNGSLAAPFHTLALAATAANASGDTIYVFQGDGTSANQNTAIALLVNQRLIGNGVALTSGKTLNGNVNETLLVAGSFPLLGGTITLANSVTVDGLDLSTTGASQGIVG